MSHELAVFTIEDGESFEDVKVRAQQAGFTSEQMYLVHDLRRTSLEVASDIIKQATEQGYALEPGKFQIVYQRPTS